VFLRGEFAAVEIGAPRDVIAYRRGGTLVLVNARSRQVRFTVTGVAVDGARDLLTDRVQRGGAVALPAYGALVLARRAP
jgi:hypothetical protein